MAPGIPLPIWRKENLVQLGKAYEYLNQFPWFEPYLHLIIASQSERTDKGWLARMFRDTTRYIAVRPLAELTLSSNPACTYTFPVPTGTVGKQKLVDDMAFSIVSAASFRISPRENSRLANAVESSISLKDKLIYSVTTTFCYRSSDRTSQSYQFEYLPSTHQIGAAVTELCEKHGHVRKRRASDGSVFRFHALTPVALIVAMMLSSRTFGTIMHTFDIYGAMPEHQPSTFDITNFCRIPHHL